MKRALPWIFWSLSLMILGFLYENQWPQFITWARVQVALQTAKHTPLRVLPGAVQFHLAPPGITIKDIQMTANTELKKYLRSLQIDRVHISVNPWQLAQGRVHIADIALQGVKGSLVIPTAGGGSNFSAEQLLKLPQRIGIPIEQIRLLDTNLNLLFPDEKLNLSVLSLNSTLSIQSDVLGLEIQSPKIGVLMNEKSLDVSISARGGLRLTKNSLQLVNLFVKQRRSIVRMNSEVDGDPFAMKFDSLETLPYGFVSLQALIDAKSISSWWNESFPNKIIPSSDGLIKLSVRGDKGSKPDPTANIQIETNKLSVSGYQIGNLSATARADANSMVFQELKLNSKSGSVVFEKPSISLKTPYAFSSGAKVINAGLNQILKDVRVGDIPVDLNFSGSLNCQGQVIGLRVNCDASLQANDFDLWSDRASNKVIVSVPAFQGQGKVSLNAQSVTYDAQLKMPNSSGTSSGTISYNDGFQIKYKADNLDFKDVADLAGLGAEGHGTVEGVTSGDSHQATFELKAKMKDAWLTNFGLGELESNVNYRKGQLYFQGVQGLLGSSPYRANVEVNFHTARLKVEADSEQVIVTDALAALSRKFQLPVSASGQGTVHARVEGPFRFNELNYDFKANVYRGTIAGESFDRLIYHVHAKDGEVRSDNVQLTKGKSLITLTGAGHPSGDIEVQIEGRQFRLEDSESINAFGSNINGIANFDMRLSGYVLAPQTDLHIVIPRMAIGEESIGSSEARIRITSRTFEGTGNLFDSRLKGEFSFPYKPSAPFRLKATSKNFNFSWLADLIVGNGERAEFSSALDSEIDLASQDGGFWNSTGYIRLRRVALRRGNQQMYLRRPVEWKAIGGNWDVETSTIEGDGTYLEIKNNKPARRKLDLSLTGKLNLGMIYLLTPPLADLRGTLSTKSQLRADENGIDVFGSGFIEKGLVKIRNLVHPFQNVRADLMFNQRKIVATSLVAEFASGTINGDAQVEVRGVRNVPVHLTATLSDADMFIPDGLRTKGSGQFELTGIWMPFLLKGTFNARSGIMTREFTDNKNTQTTVRPSVYLPQTVTSTDTNTPLRLDLNVDISKDYLVKNSQMDAAVYGNLHIMGPVNQPQFAGTVHVVRGGKVIFRENEFEIITANAIFSESQSNNPKLYISALNRFDDGTQNFDINLLLLGTAQKPDLRLSSQPPMTQEEIVSLLALGVKPEKFERNLNESQQGIQAGSRLGSALFADNAFKKQIKSKTGFDVDIGSTTQRNILAEGRRNAALDDSTGVTVPKIVVSRQWTPKFSTSASRTQGDVSTSDVKLRYKLNRSFSMIGSWQNREFDSTNIRAPVQSTLNSDSRFGVDLEYKVEFK